MPGQLDGFITKYSGDGECEWAKNISGSGRDEILTVEQTNDKGYIVGGYTSSDMELENINIKHAGIQDGIIIKYGLSGEIQWVKNIGGANVAVSINTITENKEGDYLIGGSFYKRNAYSAYLNFRSGQKYPS